MRAGTFKRRHSRLLGHVCYIFLMQILGKLLRQELIKDSVEIEALNEKHSKPDTDSNGKEM